MKKSKLVYSITILSTVFLIIFILNRIYLHYLFQENKTIWVNVDKIEIQSKLNRKIIFKWIELNQFNYDPNMTQDFQKIIFKFKEGNRKLIYGDSVNKIKPILNSNSIEILNKQNGQIDSLMEYFKNQQIITSKYYYSFLHTLKSHSEDLYEIQKNEINNNFNIMDSKTYTNKIVAIVSLLLLLLFIVFVILPVEKKYLKGIYTLKENFDIIGILNHNSLESHVFIDTNYNITFLNSNASQLFNKFSNDNHIFSGRNIFECVPQNFENKLIEILPSVLKGEFKTIEFTEKIGDTNSDVWFLGRFDPVIINNQIKGVAIMIKDITDEVELRNRNEIKKNKLNKIAWEQSHLIRAHVSNILGLTYVLTNPNFEMESSQKEKLLTTIRSESLLLDEVIKKSPAYMISNDNHKF